MSQEFAIGQKLGDYEVLGVLGAGGMGKVYKVRNVISDRIEAMKILLPNLTSQKELAERFLREIKVLASLDHPNIAALRTALTLDDQLVMIMEFVEGVTIGSRLQSGPIPPAEAVNYTDQVLAALSYAHKLNVIHRDIKPANMMLTPQRVVKLMDFGIARSGSEVGLTVTGTTLGSLNYMPPEQVNAQPVDARSDLYSLAVSLYEMVTGRLPFKGDSAFSLMAAHLQEAPPPPITLRPDLPKGLNEIILMNLAKEPEKRFQSADAFRNALQSVDLGETTFGSNPVAVSAPSISASRPTGAGLSPATGSRPADVPMTAPLASLPQTHPVAAASASIPPPPPAVQPSHRGLYMALGALVVFTVLVAAGFGLPGWIKTHAFGLSKSSAPAASAPPANSTAAGATNSAPVSQPGVADTPVASENPLTLAAPVSEPPGAKVPSPAELLRSPLAKHSVPAQDVEPQPNGAASPQAPAPDVAALEELSMQADQLSGRVSAASQSLELFKRQQSAQGYGLRGDMVAAEELMQTYLGRGQSAIDKQDAANAKKYLDLASAQVEKVEKFLGR